MGEARQAIPNVYVSLQELAALKQAGQSFTYLPRQPVTSLLSGRRASRLRGRGLSFEEMRLYQVGDDPRTIDWKATARTRKTHVRVYTEERERPALLVVDQRLSMFFGSRRFMKSVMAARGAALSAWRVVSMGDRVGAVVFNDSDIAELRPHRSERNVMRILGVVVDFNQRLSANADHSRDPSALDRALRHTLKLATHDYLIVIISDFDGAGRTTRKLVTELRRHNDVLTAPVVDPLEAELPDIGEVVVTDGTMQVEANTSDSGLRTRYQARHRKLTELRQSLALRYDVPQVVLWTDRDVPEQVREKLGRRPRTRRG